MYNNQNSTTKMKENFDNKVANDVATKKKKYVSPEIEVIELDNQLQLLAGSFTGGAGTRGLTNGVWDDEED